MNKIAVLLTVYNRIQLTIKCLDHFYKAAEKTPNIEYDIYLTDDNSSDDTDSKISKLYPKIRLIKGSGKLFWCRGMILAWEYALNQDIDYDGYLWLNNDSFIYENSLNSFLKWSKEKNDQSIISGAFQSDITGKPTYGGRLNGQVMNLAPNGTLQSIDWLNGNFVLIPKYVYNKIGILDPIFHHAIGDYDYGMRAKQNGIGLYLSKEYIGTCEDRNKLQGCYDKNNNLFKRFRIFYSPLGDDPFQRFVFLRRHYSIFKGVKSFIVTHLYVMFPSIIDIVIKRKI